jgi:hypothetical protein
MDSEPFYKSERCFRRYEFFIHQALKTFPSVFRFEAQDGRSPATDAARCRDAITGWITNRWPTHFDADPVKISSLSVWQEPNGSIAIGPKGVNPMVRLSNHAVGMSKDKPKPFPRDVAESDPRWAQDPPQPKRVFDSIEHAISCIDSGEHTEPVIFPYNPDNLSETQKHIEGKLNVAFYVKDNLIHIF